MVELKITGQLAELGFTKDELMIVSNCLNEVCNGIELPEFHAQVGAQREEVLLLLQQLSRVYDQMEHGA